MSDNSVEVNFDDEEQDMIVHMYVHQTMGKESISVFEDEVENTGDIKQALYHAAINDMVNIALAKYVEHHRVGQGSDTSGTSE